MARITTTRNNGSLIIKVQRSLDHPEEAAVVMGATESLRIHAPNGGYLFSLAVDAAGHIIQYQDGMFHEQPRGIRLNPTRIN